MKNQDYHHRRYLTISSAVSKLSYLFVNICIPIRNSFYYDLVCEKEFNLYRIKVIYTNCKQSSGSYVANIRKSGGYFSKKETKLPFNPKFCDYLFVETPEDYFLIPSEEISTKRSITLSMFEVFKIKPD